MTGLELTFGRAVSFSTLFWSEPFHSTMIISDNF